MFDRIKRRIQKRQILASPTTGDEKRAIRLFRVPWVGKGTLTDPKVPKYSKWVDIFSIQRDEGRTCIVVFHANKPALDRIERRYDVERL